MRLPGQPISVPAILPAAKVLPSICAVPEYWLHAEVPLTDWSRLFLVPGMGHCGGGARTLDQFDLLTPLVDWVESGKAPERVIATSPASPGESRPLCPFPSYPRYSGTGDPRDAANHVCGGPVGE